MKNSCIIAPIHPPDFSPIGVNFISSYNRHFNDSDIFLVFSSREESEQFQKLSNGLNYGSIVCDEPIGPSPITQKKIFGLKYIFNHTNYDKAGVIDVDTLFFRSINYDACFERYITNKKILAAYSTIHSHVRNIIKSPLKFFKEDDAQIIRKLTHEFKGYFWFIDVPVYFKKYFLNFLDYIDYEHNKSKLQYSDFDYIVYGYYLLINNLAELDYFKVNGDIIDLPYSLLESYFRMDSSEFEQLARNWNPMWLYSDVNSNLSENAFIRLHVPRQPSD